MSEAIKPDLTLNMKREWFAKIWNGDKKVEYRECKPYWTARIGSWIGKPRGKFVLMVLGYNRTTPAMLLQVASVDVGNCPYEGWDGVYYRIRFEVVGHYFKDGKRITPFMEVPRMKEVA